MSFDWLVNLCSHSEKQKKDGNVTRLLIFSENLCEFVRRSQLISATHTKAGLWVIRWTRKCRKIMYGKALYHGFEKDKLQSKSWFVFDYIHTSLILPFMHILQTFTINIVLNFKE